MDKICQTCGYGEKDFSRYLIYCTECWDTVEHIYCLGLSADDISEDFSWKCDSCPSTVELLAKVIKYGDKQDEKVEFAGSGPLRILDFALPDASAIPVVGPIWRGVFNTVGSLYTSLKGLEAFMPKTSYSKVVNLVQSMPPSIFFSMKKRCEVWPKDFDELGAAACNIGLYIFPEFLRNEADYNVLMEYMKSNDLAMTAKIKNLELLVFTSFEILAPEKRKIQGKYYLWGTFKEKEFRQESPSTCYRPSAVKNGTGKGVRAVGCPGEKTASLSTPLSTKTGAISKQWKTLKKTRKIRSHLRRECIPPLRPECKRARSKRGKERKVVSGNDQKATMLFQTSNKQSLAETCPIVEAPHPEECLPRVKIKIPKTTTVDESSVITSGKQVSAGLPNDMIDSSENIIKLKSSKVDDRSASQDPKELVPPLTTLTKERSQNNETLNICDVSRSSLGNPFDSKDCGEETISVKPIKGFNSQQQGSNWSATVRESRIIEGKSAEAEQLNCEDGIKLHGALLPNELLESSQLQLQDSSVYLASNPMNKAFLVPSVGNQEDSEVKEPNPSSNGQSNPFSKDEPLADHQYTVDKKVFHEVNSPADDGLPQFPPLEDQHEIPLEKGLSATPVIVDLEEEKPEAFIPSSVAPIVILDFDGEESPKSGSESFRESSFMTIPASILEMAGNYHDINSNCVGTQVGRYNIKSDLAPTLTKILEMHGDIALNCKIDPKVPLENICKAVQDLESVCLSGLRSHHVNHLRSVLQLGEAVGINVKWLCKRCNYLEKLASYLSQYPTLRSELAHTKKDIQHREEMLSSKRTMEANLLPEIKSLEAELEPLKEYKEKLDSALQYITSIFRTFHDKSLVVGLL
uniref:AIPP2-like SPOC-like domain-containing protein n=1 Tax=Chenopodium quinoa TaxID=63459 RepID=A0A803LHR9_CHEQI